MHVGDSIVDKCPNAHLAKNTFFVYLAKTFMVWKHMHD